MQVEKQVTQGFEETQEAGQDFAGRILFLGPQKEAVVLALQGDLGAGKTTFLQGFARGLGIREVINSPTFVIMKKFSISDIFFKHFYHFDLYRLENEKDLELLDFKKIISSPENIVAIEWSEKLGNRLPQNAIKIKLDHLEENKREIVLGI